MREYTPTQLLNGSDSPLVEADHSAFPSVDSPTLIRRVLYDSVTWNTTHFALHSRSLPVSLLIERTMPMRFAEEEIEARDYVDRVLEVGDQIDVVVGPSSGSNTALEVLMFWIHIEYVGDPSAAGNYKKKDDGLFALRTKSGEKAERLAAKAWVAAGHILPQSELTTPEFFEIRYADKRDRRPDRTCLQCGLSLEVKKRNKDRRFRVSHSDTRPFESENRPEDYHAIVTKDMQPHFFPNSDIIAAIRSNQYNAASDRYDSWIDLQIAIPEKGPLPPECTGG